MRRTTQPHTEGYSILCPRTLLFFSALLEMVVENDLRGCCARSEGGAVAEPFLTTIGV